jgi:hypothetical protein
LARLPLSCTIDADRNRLSYEAVQAFQAQIAQQRPLRGPVFHFSIYDPNKLSDNSTLEEIITFWLQQFQGNFSCENFNYKALPTCMFENIDGNDFYAPLKNLSIQDLNNLRTYLIRLKQTKDFKHPDACQGLMVNVMHMLHGACTNKDFNKMLFLLLEDALSTCVDRVADTSNIIHLQWLLLCGSKHLSKKDVAKLLIGAMRLDRLEDFARQFVKQKQLGDDIETILYFKVQLKEVLGLPIATEGMLYPKMSGVTPLDLQEAYVFVLEQTSSFEQIVRILSASDVWKKKLEREHAEQFAAINEQFTAKINDVLESRLGRIEIDILIGQLTKQRGEAIDALMTELTLVLKGDRNAFCPASQVLIGLGLTTGKQYSAKLGCTPKHLQSIGIFTAADLEVLGIAYHHPVSHMPKPEAVVERANDSRELQAAALEKKILVMDYLKNLEEQVKIGLKSSHLQDESTQKAYSFLLGKINVTCGKLQNQCQASKTLLQTFAPKSHLQIVNQVNALIDEFNAIDCALQTAQLNAYVSQWGILKAWKGLKEQGICCLADLREQRSMSQEAFFQMGV